MSDSEQEEVFSADENEVQNEAPGNATYIKPELAGPSKKKQKTSHPTYLEMVVEAVEKLQSRSGVSRSKITEYVKGAFELDDVNSVYLNKAIKQALEKNMIENVTGSGGNGSFKLQKDHKEARKKSANEKVKKEKAKEKLKLKAEKAKDKEAAKVKEKSEKTATKSKKEPKKEKKEKASTTTTKKTTKSKDDMELIKVKSKKTAKGKENTKPATAKGSKSKSDDAPKKKLVKSSSAGDISKAKSAIARSLPEVPDEGSKAKKAKTTKSTKSKK